MKEKKQETLKDELIQKYVFQPIANEVLFTIANGEFNAVEAAKKELASRGLGRGGEWVGFEGAEKIWGLK